MSHQSSLLAAWSHHCGVAGQPPSAEFAAGFTAAWAQQQAVVDRLMLEHCPGEMTPEQYQAWAVSQRPALAQG